MLRLLVFCGPGEDLSTIERELEGFELTSTSSLDRALTALRSASFDLLIAFQETPRAAELLREASALGPRIKRLVIAAPGEMSALVAPLRRGEIDRVQPWPASERVLSEAVRALAGLRRTCVVIDGDRSRAESIASLLRDLRLTIADGARGGRVDLAVLVGSEVASLDPEAGPKPKRVLLLVPEDTPPDRAAHATTTADDLCYLPLRPAEIEQRVTRLLAQIQADEEEQRIRSELGRSSFFQIVGDAPPMRRIFDLIERVAASQATVLIRGETGTGKELVARAIHAASPRRDKPFVAVNLGAIPEGLLEAELFGHKAGAFTGAVSARVGRFESVQGGTLFFDEIGDLPATAQLRLLRVLQERHFERLGEHTPRATEFRLVCATHRDLRALVASGQMREDLFHRLNVVEIELPPLRDRKEDIPLLAQTFLARFCARDGVRVSLTGAALEALKSYSWPGNVRELEHAIERAVAISREGDVITPELVTPREGRTQIKLLLEDYVEGPARSLDELLLEVERTIIAETLRRYEGNQSAAARRLKINRQTLRHRLKKLGLE
jgi:two-component system, NtrC family, response regulator AtoC